MQTTLPPLTHKPEAYPKPAPPSADILERLKRAFPERGFPPLDSRGVPQEEAPRPFPPALRREPAAVVEPHPLLRFEFKKPWGNTYTTKDYKFVLRTEHFPELIRLVSEFNKNRPEGEFPIGVSDIITAALDLVFEHPLVLTGLERSEQIREVMARAVYRKALFRFIQLYDLC